MSRRKVEVFSAGCPVCEDAIEMVREAACPSCEVEVLDIHEQSVTARARNLGIRSVPAVAIDGMLADCCSESGPDESVLKMAGLGKR
jgi:glutaredoxin